MEKVMMGALALLWVYICTTNVEGHVWEMPGCHKIGHTQHIRIPGCFEFNITTNACRGFCESWALPTSWVQVDDATAENRLTSIGQCCNIMETEDILVDVMCIRGPKVVVFKSAITCSCFHCKKY